MTDRVRPRVGATVAGNATRFEVWAPAATNVEIGIVRERGIDAAPLEQVPVDPDEPGVRGSWTITMAGVGDGDCYRYRIDGGDWLADPASRRQPEGVHGPSAVVDHMAFRWTDRRWTGVALADTVLYELHVGTFTPAGTFDAAIAQLPRLHELGVTAVEVMPVAAFPGERNWGYDGVFPFAVQESYGGPAGLAGFVDAAHEQGLAVILDVVYNHVGPEGNVLGRFGPYFTDTYSTPWGDAVNVAGPSSDGVRRFFIENAEGWIADFHLDGLRLDAVHAIVDPTPIPFVEELTHAVHAIGASQGREVLVTIESSMNRPRIVRPPEAHGWGCDAVWNDDVHHSLRVALTGERHEYYAGYDGVRDLATAFEHRWVYRGQYSPVFDRRHGAPADDVAPTHFVVFAQNHDHVGNTPRGDRLLAHTAPNDPRRRLAPTAILLSPFVPMLFMGEEYGETAPFPYFVDHGDPELIDAVRRGRAREFGGTDWSTDVADPADPQTFQQAILDPSCAGRAPHRPLLEMYRELLRVRRAHPIVTAPTAAQVAAVTDGVLVFERAHDGMVASLVMHFGETPTAGGHLSAHQATGAVTVFDSADARWGGPGGGAPNDPLTPWSGRLVIASG